VAWDKQAEVCNQYLHKGSPVFIEGRLQSRSWEDNNGQKRNVVEVRAERVQFLGSKGTPKQENAPLAVDESPAEPTTEAAWLGESEGRQDEA
jgi:single-strand DNA-binding protein